MWKGDADAQHTARIGFTLPRLPYMRSSAKLVQGRLNRTLSSLQWWSIGPEWGSLCQCMKQRATVESLQQQSIIWSRASRSLTFKSSESNECG